MGCRRGLSARSRKPWGRFAPTRVRISPPPPRPYSSTDRVAVSGTVDAGSIPAGGTILREYNRGMRGKYVSRAGVKLEAALRHFGVEVEGRVVLDVGAATGGFTDCLLRQGAVRVHAVETGYGLLAWKLRQDPRVVVWERTNILYQVPIGEKVDLAVVDTSWTRLHLAIPAASRFVKVGGVILALIKPQYEVEKKKLKKGVLGEGRAREVAEEVRRRLMELGFRLTEVVESAIKGEGGNSEFWVRIDL